MTSTLQPGQLADFVPSWDQLKLNLNYEDGEDEDLEITLSGRKVNHAVDADLPASEVRGIFERALKEVYRVLSQTIKQVSKLGKTFAVLFTGGTSLNTGFRSVVQKQMKTLGGVFSLPDKDTQKATKQVKKWTFVYDYLGQMDRHWFVPLTRLTWFPGCLLPRSPGVAGGSALTSFDPPPLINVFDGSGIGIQVCSRQGSRRLATRRDLRTGWSHDSHVREDAYAPPPPGGLPI